MTDKDLEKAVIQAKKDLSIEEIKDTVRKCSYGGKTVTMDLKAPSFNCWGDDGGIEAVIPLNRLTKGGEKFGKTNT